MNALLISLILTELGKTFLVLLLHLSHDLVDSLSPLERLRRCEFDPIRDLVLGSDNKLAFDYLQTRIQAI